MKNRLIFYIAFVFIRNIFSEVTQNLFLGQYQNLVPEKLGVAQLWQLTWHTARTQ